MLARTDPPSNPCTCLTSTLSETELSPGALTTFRTEPLPPESFTVSETVFVPGLAPPVSVMEMSKRMLRGGGAPCLADATTNGATGAGCATGAATAGGGGGVGAAAGAGDAGRAGGAGCACAAATVCSANCTGACAQVVAAVTTLNSAA